MREVSGCDFCGNTPSGTFDVLPPEYDPEGKGKRMVLCDHCRDALASILDPLLDAKDDVEPRVDVDPESVGSSEDTAEQSPSSGRTTDAKRTEVDESGRVDESDETHDASDAEKTDEEATESDGPRMAKTADGTSSRVPKGYRKTLRFLQNRETPIERDAAVEMVSEAYGFDPEAVEAALDHAVKHGRLKQLQDEIDVP